MKRFVVEIPEEELQIAKAHVEALGEGDDEFLEGVLETMSADLSPGGGIQHTGITVTEIHMKDSFEIQRFVKTNEPILTIDWAYDRKTATEKFVKALENNPGEAIRLIQTVIDFTTMEVSEE